MRMSLFTNSNSFDRSAIMRDAHRQWRSMGARGWTWGRCLSFAWARARKRREDALVYQAAVVSFKTAPRVKYSTNNRWAA